MEEAGADLLEISGGNYESVVIFNGTPSKREAYFLEFAAAAKQKLSTTKNIVTTKPNLEKMPLMVTGGFRSRETMQNAIASNSLDVIGLGRPFCHESIETMRGLLDGTTQMLKDPNVTTGVALLDNGVAAIWFSEQIRRMAKGLEPDLNLGVMKLALFAPLRIYISSSCTIL